MYLKSVAFSTLTLEGLVETACARPLAFLLGFSFLIQLPENGEKVCFKVTGSSFTDEDAGRTHLALLLFSNRVKLLCSCRARSGLIKIVIHQLRY